jgi:type II secretory pathway pseudopilin PulG
MKINLRNGKSRKSKMNKKGFSLLEILIYAGVFVVVAGSITGILVNVLNVTSQQQASSEVDENLRQIIAIMGDKIRQSSLIETATDTNLILKVADFSTTTFSVSDDILYLTEGGNEPVSLLSNKVKVGSLDFQKIEQVGTKGGVRVNISLVYDDPRPNFSISKSLTSTINRAAAISFGEDILPSINNLYSVGADNPRWLNGYFSGNVDVDGNLDATQLCIAGDCKSAWSAIGNIIGTGTTNYISKWASTSTLENSLIYDNGTSLGIGTESPNAQLDIGDDLIIGGGEDDSPGLKFTDTSGDQLWFDNGDVRATVHDGFGNFSLKHADHDDKYISTFGAWKFRGDNAGKIYLQTAPAGTVGNSITWNTALYINSSGDIKLGGTTSPSEKLDIVGNIGLTGTIIPDNNCGIAGTVLTYRESVSVPSNTILGGASIGDAMACSGKVLRISGQCNYIDPGHDVSMELRKNDISQVCDIDNMSSSQTGYSTSCNISFSANDIIGCYSKTSSYASSCTCAIYVRFD